MRRWVWVGLLLSGVGCFADPPVVGGTTVGNTSNGTSESTSTAATDSSQSGDPSMTSSQQTSAEVTGTNEATSSTPATSVDPVPTTGESFGEVTAPPSESGAGGCMCGFDPESVRNDGGAYECLPDLAAVGTCPMDFGPGSICMTAAVQREGCCDPMSNVVWCPDMAAGTVAEIIDCTTTCSL